MLPVHAGRQGMTFSQGNVVQPRSAVATGVDAGIERTVAILLGLVVVPANLQRDGPRLQRRVPGATAQHSLFHIRIGSKTDSAACNPIVVDSVVIVVRLGSQG
ncbi:hypothetical protein D9M68_965670 [compost metagenome]